MAVRTIIAPDEVRQSTSDWRIQRHKIAFVPTMGALHEGHLALVDAAKQQADRVVVSIFVNPLQFGPKEDFATYPRMLQEDRAKLDERGVDALFIPNAMDMYPAHYQTYIYNDKMADILCGAFRPGHFQGVLTVVAKLFHLVQPDIALFGKKDYQQFKLLSKMVSDLMFGLTVVGLETLREADGLAMSSRNLRLTPDERREAPQLYRSLQSVQQAYQAGERQLAPLLAIFRDELNKSSGFRLEYAEIRYQDGLEAGDEQLSKPCVILVAAYLGSVRLIDNLELSE